VETSTDVNVEMGVNFASHPESDRPSGESIIGGEEKTRSCSKPVRLKRLHCGKDTPFFARHIEHDMSRGTVKL
jgi:hypothetical protein